MRQLIVIVLCLLGIASTHRHSVSDNAHSLAYTLSFDKSHYHSGESGAFKLALTNNTPQDITIYGSEYAFVVSGTGGKANWPIGGVHSSMPWNLLIPAGQTRYYWGSDADFFPYPYISNAPDGHYSIKYCDVLRVKGTPTEICSNKVKITIGTGSDDGDSERDDH